MRFSSRARCGCQLLQLLFVGLVAFAASLPTPVAAQSPAKTTFTHPTGEYALDLPEDWNHARFDSGQGSIGVVVGPAADRDFQAVAKGIWIHLVPITSDEYVTSDGMVEFAEALLKRVHPEQHLDRAKSRPITWGKVSGTAWPVKSAGDQPTTRRGEFQLIVLRDGLLAAEASSPVADWEADSKAFAVTLSGLRLLPRPPIVAKPPQDPERPSQIAARYKSSVPSLYAKARSDSDPATGEPAPFESLKGFYGGTGFLVSKDGYVITNRHVIERKSESSKTRFLYDPVGLTWDETTELPEEVADVVAVSRKWDLALLKIRGNRTWTPFPMADMSQVQVAQQVLVMGWPDIGSNSPDLLHHNWNIIAGLERDPKLRTRVLRHGARTTSGNSGGPVYGLEAGGIVGVHTQGYISRAKNFEDMFQHGAVPTDRVLWEFPQVFGGLEEDVSLDERVAKAGHYFRQQRFGAATLECRRILEKSPENGPAHAYLYRMQRLQNEPHFAENHFAPAIADPASRVQTHVFAARSALEEGDVTTLGKHAAQAATAARELKQDETECDLMLAYALSREALFEITFAESGRMDYEARTMQGAARLRTWLIQRQVTRLTPETKISDSEWAAIDEILRHSLRLWPVQARAYVYRSLLMAFGERVGDARNNAEVARALGGHDPEILIALAYGNLLAGDPRSALIDAATALRTRATLPASYMLGAASVRYANLLDEFGVDSPERIQGLELLAKLKLPADTVKLRADGTERVKSARFAVQARMATQLDKTALLGWWDFAIFAPLEK